MLSFSKVRLFPATAVSPPKTLYVNVGSALSLLDMHSFVRFLAFWVTALHAPRFHRPVLNDPPVKKNPNNSRFKLVKVGVTTYK